MSPAEKQQITERLLGPVRWESPSAGFCRCPGESSHTTPTRGDACKVHLDGAPTIFCFHSHCQTAVDAANLQLRRALSERMPGSYSPVGFRPTATKDAIARSVEATAPRIQEELPWPYDAILRSSPIPLDGLSPKDQFLRWLGIWPDGVTIWMGDTTDTGQQRHKTHFRTITAWKARGTPLGNFTCPSSFKPGSYSRSEAQVEQRCFLVVESDTLTRDQVGAVFRYLCQRLCYRLHCVIDTGGKSLHGWFSPPARAHVAGLKSTLTALGCDQKMFGVSQPCRVPGAMRGDKLQRLLWLRAPPGL